jgi:hypothetical protein
MAESWLPENYEVPGGKGRYMRLAAGDNKFRVLDRPLLGYQGWNVDDKGRMHPVRKPLDTFEPDEVDLKTVRHFWAMPVFNYSTGAIEVLSITQATVQKAIRQLAFDPDWGSPGRYDIVVSRDGSGLDTKYSVRPQPPKPLPADIRDQWREMKSNGFDMTRLFNGGDPFGEQAPQAKQSDEDENLPF